MELWKGMALETGKPVKILALHFPSHVMLRKFLAYLNLSLLMFKNEENNTYIVMLLWALKVM